MAVNERHLSVVTMEDAEKIQLIKNTVARGASDNEFQMFIHLASRYNLDPFAKEIWCIKRNQTDAATIMTSRDGYLKIAQSDPNFDGLKSFVVREGDHFEIDAQSDQVVHKFGAKRGAILGAWAICHHKKRKPSMCFVDFAEYNSASPVWRKYPSAMIQKVAEVFVLKRQFNINGLVTFEEMDSTYEPSKAIDVTPEKPLSIGESVFAPDEKKTKKPSRRELAAEVFQAMTTLAEYATKLGINPKTLRSYKPEKEVVNWTIEDCEEVRSMIAAEHAKKYEAGDANEADDVGGNAPTDHAGDQATE